MYTRLVDWLHRAIEVLNIWCRAGDKTNAHNKTAKRYAKQKLINALWPGLCGDKAKMRFRSHSNLLLPSVL